LVANRPSPLAERPTWKEYDGMASAADLRFPPSRGPSAWELQIQKPH
jgi:hypothetical protein